MSTSSVPSTWVKCISTQGNIRGVAIQATQLIQEISEIHSLTSRGTSGMGEAVMGALLIASSCKPGERVNLNVQGSGYFKQGLVDADPNGLVRGYVIERKSEETLIDPGFGPWGQGLLSVLRTKDENTGKPYIGTVPLLTGHLAKDLSFYWVQSEQIPSAVGLAVNLKNDGVISAGAFLVQVLPGASLSEVKSIENHIHEMHSLSEKLTEETKPIHLLSHIFQSTAFMLVEERTLKFECNCSWERVQRALILVGAAELQSMLEEDHGAVIHCDFCTKEYRVDGVTLKKLIESAKS